MQKRGGLQTLRGGAVGIVAFSAGHQQTFQHSLDIIGLCNLRSAAISDAKDKGLQMSRGGAVGIVAFSAGHQQTFQQSLDIIGLCNLRSAAISDAKEGVCK